MKKILILFFVSIFSFKVFSQSLALAEETEKKEIEEIKEFKHGEKKFTFNVFYSPILNSSLTHTDENKFENSYGVDLLFNIKKTYTYFGFDVKKKAINTTIGCLLTEKHGIYTFFSHQVKSDFDEELKIKLPKENVLSLGFEYFIEKKYVDTIIFYEFGTSFSGEEKIFRNNFFSVGLIFEGHAFKF